MNCSKYKREKVQEQNKRREQLRKLVNELAQGSCTKYSKLVDITRECISGMMLGYRNVSDKALQPKGGENEEANCEGVAKETL